MYNMQILDCTLRDGGYYTDWNFSKNLIDNYLKTVSKLPISIVELGYLSNQEDFNGQFYHLNKELLQKAKLILRRDQKVFAMINFKEINNKKDLEKLIKNKTKYLDGVRFAVAPKDINKIVGILNPLIKKYKKKLTFNINLMYLSKWIEDDKFIKKTLSLLDTKINVVSFVDSYGALMPNKIEKFLKKVKKIPVKKLKFGCHFHNNCGLALANTISANNSGCEIVDSTFRGMGRGAGNAETELLLATQENKRNRISGFDLNNLLEVFEELKIDMKWGSSFAYAFAATNGFSQSEMMNLMQKRRLDPGTAVKAITNSLNKEKNIKFKNLNNLSKLSRDKLNSPIIIGGSPSFLDYGEYFFEKISKKAPIILSGSRALFNYLKLELVIKNPIILILSGSEIKKISFIKDKKIFKKINLYGIIAEEDFLPDNINFDNKIKIVKSNSIALNPLLLFGKACLNRNIKKIFLAFFDGNPENEKGRIVMKETQESVDELFKKGLKIFTYTKSFLKLKQKNPWLDD